MIQYISAEIVDINLQTVFIIVTQIMWPPCGYSGWKLFPVGRSASIRANPLFSLLLACSLAQADYCKAESIFRQAAHNVFETVLHVKPE